MEEPVLNKSFLLDAVLILGFLGFIYFTRSFIQPIFVAIMSIGVFLILYNIYALRSFKGGAHPPLWILPMALFMYSLIVQYSVDLSVFLFYAVIIVLIGIISGSKAINEIYSGLITNYYGLISIYLFLVVVLISPVYGKAWIILGPIAEYLVIGYMIYFLKNYGLLATLGTYTTAIYLLMIALSVSLASLHSYILVLYSFSFNILKYYGRNSIVFPYIILLDHMNRFFFMGGINWITSMLLLA